MNCAHRRLALVIVASVMTSGCCFAPPDASLACCPKLENVVDLFNATSGPNATYYLDVIHDAGVPPNFVLHGERCRPFCGWDARECSYGPLECLAQGVFRPLQHNPCAQRPDGGPSPQFHPDVLVIRCAPGVNFGRCVGGRLSLTSKPPTAWQTLSDSLSTLAALEHQSITAFTEMASFLAFHGAPASLLSRLAVAAEDESRHTQAMIHLAEHLEKFTPTLPTSTATHPPSLLAFALHNAREGCVRETYGASLAHYQAQHATDPLVRDTFATIAIEESQHAQLSWDVAHWVDTLLTESERALVAHAITEATEDLAQSLAQPSPREWRDTLGLPSADVALAMHHQLRRSLWSAHAPN